MVKELLTSLVALSTVFSTTPSQIPEVNGVYDDPGHPGIKVRVFVHQQKPDGHGGKPNPNPTPAPTLTCNLADPESSSVEGTTGWKLPSDWTYNLNTSSVPSSVSGSNLPSFAETAFDTWATASGSKIAFTRGDDTTVNKQALDYKNVVTWGRTQGTALAVTYTRYNSATNEVVDVDTIMNQKFAWSWSNQAQCAYSGSYDAQNILTHELGHWMGLDDEYDTSFENNTMFGYGDKEEVKKDTLTQGDKDAVFSLYN